MRLDALVTATAGTCQTSTEQISITSCSSSASRRTQDNMNDAISTRRAAATGTTTAIALTVTQVSSAEIDRSSTSAALLLSPDTQTAMAASVGAYCKL